MKKVRMFLGVSCFILVGAGCNKGGNHSEELSNTVLSNEQDVVKPIASDSPATTQEIAITEIASQLSATEGSETKINTNLENAGINDDSCGFGPIARTTCDNSKTYLNWNHCAVHSGSVTSFIDASYFESWSLGACTTGLFPSGLSVGKSVNRRINNSGQMIFQVDYQEDQEITESRSSAAASNSGEILLIDNNGGTAYDGTIIGSTGTRIQNIDGIKEIIFFGTHFIRKSVENIIVYEQYLLNSYNNEQADKLQVSGDLASATRTLNGVVSVLAQARYKAVHHFSNVRWGLTNCSYPTAGIITTQFTGILVGSSTMEFTNNCGLVRVSNFKGEFSLAKLTLAH